MGCDIHGYIECRSRWENGRWSAAMDFDLIGGLRHYDAFGLLFGIRNYGGFEPLAPNRGLPEDIAAVTRAEHTQWGAAAHSPTWIGWDEITGIDWDRRAEEPDSRIHEFRRGTDGEWVRAGKAAWSAAFAELAGKSGPPALGYDETWPEGTEWVDGDRMFRVVRMTRREVIDAHPQWQRTWTVMSTLAEVHGAQHVRLVVWFDN
ncbi:hypothetical protein ACFVMC_18260 [Nocardia sp. NPDC127579]|uniref:hypothetical protein n=1 Tax=Nocardia sp. NPDC127579 TaxID=3345402 RepID=UPI003638E1AD